LKWIFPHSACFVSSHASPFIDVDGMIIEVSRG